MHRFLSLAALLIVVLGASLLLRAQPNDPFGAAPTAPAKKPPPDPFAPPQDDPFGTPAVPANNPPADPFAPAPAAPAPKTETPPIGKNWPADAANSSYSEIVFADESLGKDVLRKMTPAERMAYHLNRPARITLHPPHEFLPTIVEVLLERLQVNVELDRKALENAGFDTATPIEWVMRQPANLGAALRRMLNSKGLDYVRLNDTLLITTRDAFEEKLFVKTYSLDREMFHPKTAWKYEVQYHAQVGAGGSLGFAGAGGYAPGAGSSGNTGDDDALVEIIQLIQPESWIAHGGRGRLHLDLKCSLLVVNQRQDVHDEIETLLADLRKVASSNQQAIKANAQLERRVVFRLKIPEKQAGPARPLEGGGNFIPLEPAFTLKEVADLIKQQIEPHSWKDEKHTITILGECLIINQSEAVQTKISQFLLELGITRQQHDENNRPFYGFS